MTLGVGLRTRLWTKIGVFCKYLTAHEPEYGSICGFGSKDQSSQHDRTSSATNMNHSLLVVEYNGQTPATHRGCNWGCGMFDCSHRRKLDPRHRKQPFQRVSGLIRRVASRSPRRKMISVSVKFRLRTFLVHGVQTVYLWMQTNFGHGASRCFCFSIFRLSI